MNVCSFPGCVRSLSFAVIRSSENTPTKLPEGNSPTISTMSGGNLEPKIMRNADKERTTITKLTEHECLMLQGFTSAEADRIVKAVDSKGRRKYSKTVCYRFAGNAVCVNCFERITEQILTDMVSPRKDTLDSFMGADV